MKNKPLRKPNRRDLLVVIGRLQGLVGDARAANNDRNKDRQAQVDDALDRALDLCISTRSFDPPLPDSGPFSETNFPNNAPRGI